MAPKNKLSKKELDKKKKDEDDRKHQEEEEARMAEEKEEKEREKKEKIEEEERKKIEKIELKKRSVELDEFRSIKEIHENKLSEDEKNRRYQYSWERYLRCDGSPDPSIPQEINTYINLWREDEKNIMIEPIMNEGLLCLRLIEELEFLITDYSSDEMFQKQISKYNETISELQILLQDKIDRASLELLSRASTMSEIESSNFEKAWKYEKMILCLWGNLTKHSKGAKVEFLDIGVTVTIPKVLITSDIAFRILYTKYDHYSSNSKYFKSRPKIIETIENAFESVVVSSEILEDNKENEAEKEPEDQIVEVNLMDELNKVDLETEETEEKEETVLEQEEEIDSPPEDLIEITDPIQWEDFDGDENNIDLRNFAPIGGLYHINMVCLPPQPKVTSGWTITQQVIPPKLTPFRYQVSAEDMMEKTNLHEASTEREIQSASKERTDESRPVVVTMKLPEDVVICEEPQIALWNTEYNEWDTSGVTMVTYKEDEKSVTFEMSEFGVLGIFQDFHINMPFQSWTLKPYRAEINDTNSPNKLKSADETISEEKLSEDIEDNIVIEKELPFYSDSTNQCLLIVNAAVFDVKLHICDNRVRILYNDEHTELNGLANKWHSVPELVNIMRTAGINIFPREDSEKYVSTTAKNAVAENMLYDQMALLSPSVAFSWSRWNAECKNSETCMVLASEHLNYERPVNEEDWSVLSFTRKKVNKLKMKEFDETFSNEIDERIQFHSNLLHFYEEFGTEEGMIAVKNIDSHYFNTVRTLLKAIRPIVFA